MGQAADERPGAHTQQPVYLGYAVCDAVLCTMTYQDRHASAFEGHGEYRWCDGVWLADALAQATIVFVYRPLVAAQTTLRGAPTVLVR